VEEADERTIKRILSQKKYEGESGGQKSSRKQQDEDEIDIKV